MKCPKCGFEQDNAPECAHCGLIFARFREAAPPYETRSDRSPVKRAFRIIRWGIPALAIIVILLVLKSSSPPEITTSTEAAARAEEKIETFQSSLARGDPDMLEIDQSELNGWLAQNLSWQQNDSETQPIEESGSGGRARLRDLKLELREETLVAYAVVDMYGKDVSLEIEGEILNRDGYLHVNAIDGRLGSLPLSKRMLRRLIDRVFTSPENREKFRLPPGIRDIRIKNGRLLVLS
ncbi:MAG: zinc ribbon domain-containing protein [Acidobacteria bacterium]|nr:zinc ribbon domain-containing protein [Acidobacteriota bacterium]